MKMKQSYNGVMIRIIWASEYSVGVQLNSIIGNLTRKEECRSVGSASFHSQVLHWFIRQ